MLPEAAEVYSPAELVDSLSETVISTVQLFLWWRTRDWTTIRTTILGADPRQTAPSHTQAARPPASGTRPRRRRRLWPGRLE